MSKALKIVISWDCNLDCEYCCNKQSAIKESFKPITVAQISNSNYDTYQITGGEPLLPMNRRQLYEVLNAIPKGKPIYIYTNGVYLDMDIAKILRLFKVKGINLGLHHRQWSAENPIDWDELKEINKHIPIRLWVQDTVVILPDVPTEFEIHRWHMNDCADSVAERVYVVRNK